MALNPYIIPLNAAMTPGRDLIGGKAQNLMALLCGGFEVPGGFVVTTRAFSESLRGRLAGRDTPAEMRRRIVETDMGPQLLQELEAAYASLLATGASGLVVRSSAIDEDSLDQSWAGQQDSYIHVRGFDSLLLHIKKCWASIFGDSALSYHARDGFAVSDPAMAVVVQRMVYADAAGVTFTMNPVSGRQDEMVHTFSYGLGEMVVSGGDADVFVVDRATGELRDQRIVTKDRMLVAGDRDGMVEAPVPETKAAAASLDAQQIATLTQLAVGIEAEFGEPQDIEWAIESERIFCLQSRPITAGRGVNTRGSAGSRSSEEQADSTDPGVVWTNANVGEALPGVGTPFTWSIIGSFARQGFDHALGALGLVRPSAPMIRNVYGRVYLNQTALLGSLSQVPFFDGRRVVELGGGKSFSGVEEERQSSWPFLARLPLTVPVQLFSQISVPLAASWTKRKMDRRMEEMRQAVSKRPQKREVAQLFERFTAEVFTPTGTLMLSAASNALGSYVAVSLILDLFLKDPPEGIETRLFSGLSRMKSAQPGFFLLRLARIVKNQPELYRLFRSEESSEAVVETIRSAPDFKDFWREFGLFLEQHGYRAPLEAEIATPRWGDEPSSVVDLLRSYLRAGEPEDPAAFMRARVRERRRAEQELKSRLSGLGRMLLRAALPRAQNATRVREDLRDLVVKTIAFYRTLGMEAGRHLCDDGVSARPEDVFFLSYEEVLDYLNGRLDVDLSYRIALRKGQYAIFKQMREPPSMFLQRGSDVITEERVESSGEADGVLRGLAGSPGRVTGRARVLSEMAQMERLGYGDVLVTRQTDVGWTPLFLVAGAVVTEMGGPLSHACVVAREYGKPAVVSVGGATERIPDGAIVTVDGNVGEVVIYDAGHDRDAPEREA